MLILAIAAWLGGVWFHGGAIASPDLCVCRTAAQLNGWCGKHRVGSIGGLRIRSEALYETLDAHGHELDFSTFTCESCRRAIASEGFCEEHRVGFHAKKAWFSRLTYELARARWSDRASLSCRDCRRNARSSGWCGTDRVGMIGGFAIRDESAWRQADRSLRILAAADRMARRCERCAMAMVTDSQCPDHRITYRDGMPLPQ